MSKKLKQWIYKTNKECKFCVKPTSRKAVTDNLGNVIQYLTFKPIWLVFDNCHAIVNEQFARDNGIENVEDIIKMIENTRGYGTEFYLIDAPDVEPKEEDIKEFHDAPKNNNVKVIQGARSSGRGKS